MRSKGKLTKKQAIKILNELYALARVTDNLGKDPEVVDEFFRRRGFKGYDDFQGQTSTFGNRDPRYRKIDSRTWGCLIYNYIQRWRAPFER